MKLHWSSSKLIVGTIAIAMLSATPALAFPDWWLCPNGPLCPREDNLNYRLLVGHSTATANQQAAGTNLTSAQWTDLATRMQKYQTEGDANGQIAELNLFVNVNKSLFYAANFDTSKFVAALNSMGFTGNAKQMASSLALWTQAQREGYWNAVHNNGMDVIFDDVIWWLQQIAKVTYAREHGYPVRTPCGFFGDVGYWTGFAAAASLVIGQPEFAMGFGFISATAFLAGHEGGCF
jgi:hypothetical protein